MEHLLNSAVVPVSPTDFLDALPVYDTWGPNINRLDQLRAVIEAFNYSPYILAYPFGTGASSILFGGLSTKEGSLQVPVGSFLLGITGFSSTDLTGAAPVELGPGFRFSITDKGSGLGLVERGFVYSRNASGNYNDSNASEWLTQTDEPNQGAFWLDSPFIITNPGQLQVAITNLSASAASIQIALHFAYPINNVSVNTPRIKGGN